MKRDEQDIARLLKKSLPSAQQEEEVGKRVFYRLLLAKTESSIEPLPHGDEITARPTWPRLSMAIAATAVFASLFLGLLLTNSRWTTPENLTAGVLRATNPEGQMLDLPDGSHVEMRWQSEVQIDRASDGLRVRLNAGSVIVTAAKQGAGHLYVDTKDAIVSVVGTIFLVTVEPVGTRVGVLEGIVRVQHGAMSQKLLPGEQLSTNPAMEPVPLDVQVAWSRYAALYLALLHPPAPPAEPRVAAAPSPQQRQPAETNSLSIAGAPRNGTLRQPPPATSVELEMEKAFVSRELFADIAFQVETDYFQLNNAEYLVPVTLKIPGAQLTGSESAKRVSLDIQAEVNDEFGTHIANFKDTIAFPLSDEAAKALANRPITYETKFTLLPGRYSVKFLVRDGISGRIGTYQAAVVIPNLRKEALAISSVVLGSELVESNPPPLDPFLFEGKKLIPNVSRVFSQRGELILSLQAYEPNATATEPLTAFVTLYRAQTKVLSQSFAVRDELGGRLRTLPIKLRLPLASVPAGAYDFEVTVLNPATQKSAVWRAPISIVN
jgi:hypothetical protein